MLGGTKERRSRKKSKSKSKSSQSQSQIQIQIQSQAKVKQGSLANVVWSSSSRVHGHIIFSYMGYVSLYQVMSVTFREKSSTKPERESSNVDVEIVL